MTNLMLYSLVLSAALLLFWAAYKLLRIGLTSQGGFSRGVLLSLVGLASVIAAIPFLVPEKEPEVILVEQMPQPVVILDTPGEPKMAIVKAPARSIDTIRLLTWIYLGGMTASFAFMLFNIAKLARILIDAEKVSSTIRLHDYDDLVPFTWGKWMVMSRQDYQSNGAVLSAHEGAHLRGAHWLDLLAINLVGCLTWYCPAARLLRKSLIEAHEYTADRAVISQGFSAQDYQILLIEKASGRSFANSVAPCINHSSLKNRIIMMLNPLPAASAHKRALALIPVVALTIVGGTALASLRPNPAPIIQVVDKEPDEQVAPSARIAETIVAEPIAIKNNAADDESASDDGCTSDETKAEKIYSAVENMPQFEGGDNNLYRWVAMHLRYPENAMRNNIQGRVTCRFVIEKDGSIGEVKVVRSVDPELDAEAVRLIKSMPNFTPGTMNGESVRVWYTIPIAFKLTTATEAQTTPRERKNTMTIPELMRQYPGKEVWIAGVKAAPEQIESMKPEDIKKISVVNTAEANRIEINPVEVTLADQMRQNPALEVYIKGKKSTADEVEAAWNSGEEFDVTIKDPTNPGGSTRFVVLGKRTLRPLDEALKVGSN